MADVPATFVVLSEAQQDKKISNVIGVVIDLLPSKQTVSGSHMLTFTLYDRTLERGQKCRLFTKSKALLPDIQKVGDIVMLRRLRYFTDKDLLICYDGEPAAWAVFHAPISKDLGIFENGLWHVHSKGMPKVTKQEMEYVIDLGQQQNQAKFTVLAEDVKEKLTKSQPQQCLIKDLVMDSYCTIVGEVVKMYYKNDRATLYISDCTENSLLYNYGSGKKDDVQNENAREWPGPPGRYTLTIECWQPHSEWIRLNVQAGDILRIRKVHIKQNQDKRGLIDARLHEDHLHPELILVRKIKNQEAPDLFARKEQLGWGSGFAVKEDEEEDNDRKSKKRKSEDVEQAANNSSRNARRKKGRALDRKEDTPKDVVPAATPRTEIQEAVQSINDNIHCEQGKYRDRTIAEIRAISQPQSGKPSNGKAIPSEFTETTSHTTVRVADFKPFRIEDFARRVERSTDDFSESETPSSPESDSDPNNEFERSQTSILNKSTQARRTKWEWHFVLLLEDASSSSSSSSSTTPNPPNEKKPNPNKNTTTNNQLIAYLTSPSASLLLGLPPINLRTNPQTLALLREKLFILWGDLEEIKLEEARRKEEREARALADVSTNTSHSSGGNSSQTSSKATSRPFRCLIEEFGELYQGEWRRKFRLKGVTIMQGARSGRGVEGDGDGKHGLESWGDVVDESVGEGGGQGKSFRAPRAG